MGEGSSAVLMPSAELEERLKDRGLLVCVRRCAVLEVCVCVCVCVCMCVYAFYCVFSKYIMCEKGTVLECSTWPCLSVPHMVVQVG